MICSAAAAARLIGDDFACAHHANACTPPSAVEFAGGGVEADVDAEGAENDGGRLESHR